MTIEEGRFEAVTTSSPIDVTGHTLIIPCVSIGSVPQLAIDALLESNNATRIFGQPAQLISTLDHRFCIPFLGGIQSNDSQNIQGPLRVYTFQQSRLTILQQRSPIVKSRKQDFVANLMKWIEAKGFSNVVILTSLDAGLRTDAQMGHSFWYIDTGVKASSSEVLDKMKSALPVYQSSSPNTTTIPAMPSSGLAKAYLEAAVDLKKVPTQALITFAAEGDNRSDALTMASLLLSLLSLSSKSTLPFTQPSDWSLLFGSQINDSMFN